MWNHKTEWNWCLYQALLLYSSGREDWGCSWSWITYISPSRSLFTCQMMLWNTTLHSEGFVLWRNGSGLCPPTKIHHRKPLSSLSPRFSFLYLVSTFPSCLKTPPCMFSCLICVFPWCTPYFHHLHPSLLCFSSASVIFFSGSILVWTLNIILVL